MPPDTLIAKTVGKTIHNVIERQDDKISFNKNVELFFSALYLSICEAFSFLFTYDIWICGISRFFNYFLPKRITNSELALKILLEYRKDLLMVRYIVDNKITKETIYEENVCSKLLEEIIRLNTRDIKLRDSIEQLLLIDRNSKRLD